MRALLLAVLLTCPPSTERCNNPKRHPMREIKVVMLDRKGEVVKEEIVCGRKIRTEGECVIVTGDFAITVAAACPGGALMLPLPMEEE